MQNESVCTNAARDVVARGGAAGSFRRNSLDRPDFFLGDFGAHEFSSALDPERNLLSTVGHSDIGSGYYIIVTLRDAEGNSLVYQAGNHLSSLSYEGPCSEDPNMRVPTT